jgi:hypothetical protein
MRGFFLVAAIALTVPALAGPPEATAVAAGVLEGMKLDVKLSLVDAGAEPRQVLRYTPRPGATAEYETVSRTQMDMSITLPDGQNMAMPMGDAMPAMVMSARNTVGKPLPNGMIPVSVEQLGTKLEGAADPAMAAAMTDAFASLKGMTFQILVDADGKPAQVDVAGAADPALGTAIQGMADQMGDQLAHFPVEAVGPGAKWTVDMDMSMAGLDMVVQQTVTVVSITGNIVELDTVLDLDMGKGGFEMPGMPPGAKPEIKQFEGSGSGRMKTDLTTLVSTGAMTMDMNMAMTMAAPDGGGNIGMTMKMKQTTEMRAK